MHTKYGGNEDTYIRAFPGGSLSGLLHAAQDERLKNRINYCSTEFFFQRACIANEIPFIEVVRQLIKVCLWARKITEHGQADNRVLTAVA